MRGTLSGPKPAAVRAEAARRYTTLSRYPVSLNRRCGGPKVRAAGRVVKHSFMMQQGTAIGASKRSLLTVLGGAKPPRLPCSVSVAVPDCPDTGSPAPRMTMRLRCAVSQPSGCPTSSYVKPIAARSRVQRGSGAAHSVWHGTLSQRVMMHTSNAQPSQASPWAHRWREV